MSSSNEMGQGQGSLSAAAVMVAEAKQDFDRLNGTLIGHLDAARTTWVGQGSTAFAALAHAWSERQRVIVGALDGFEASLRATERDNSATDEAQAAAFDRVQQRLG
jgi:ESAT-6 family protein